MDMDLVLHYPLNIVNVEVLVQWKLFDLVGKVPFETCNNFPTPALFNIKKETPKVISVRIELNSKF